MDSKVMMWVIMVIVSLDGISSVASGTRVAKRQDNPSDYNTLSCASGMQCINIHYCTTFTVMMDQNRMPAQRFRQAICGYVGVVPKICCEVTRADANQADVTVVIYPPPRTSMGCGRSIVYSGGMKTLGTYPFTARVGFVTTTNGRMLYPCNGVIINERHVLTTASCALAKAANEDCRLHSVLVGEYDTRTEPDCNELYCAHPTRNYDVALVIRHEHFHPTTFNSNIALLRTARPIEFTLSIQPVCLSGDRYFASDEGPAVMVGWGTLGNQGKVPVQHAQTMRLLRGRECSHYNGLSIEICAVGQYEPCSGFNGSPLMRRYNDRYILIGLLSYGSDCNPSCNYPTVFVDIHKHVTWILDHSQ